VALVATTFVATAPKAANAAASSSSSCTSGVGYGGVGSTTLSATQGGNGCVFIKYTISGTDYYETFNYTGVDQSWTVPSGVSSATFNLIGAGGGGVPLGASYGSGGGGGYATGSYAVTTGQIFTIIVGQAGGGVLASLVSTNCYRTPATYGGGGRSGSCYGSGLAYADRGASGGGRSAIRLSGATTDLATAAGGGGGGWQSSGGGGGGTTGVNVTNGGQGGTQSAGGTVTANGLTVLATNGSAYLGGNGYHQSGGGGGGYFGGGGGNSLGGGGGGSSYIALLTSGSTTAGSGITPGLVAPTNTVAPTIAGTALVGSTLTATGGTWSRSGTSSWQWQSSTNGSTYTDISGETTSSITTTGALYYRAVEMLTSSFGTGSANSTAIKVIAVPGAPTGLTGTFGNESVSLTWTAPTDNGGSALTDYITQYSSDGTTWSTFPDGTVSATASSSVTRLTNYATYYFRVAAVNAVGTGSYSSAISVIPGVTPGSVGTTIASIGNTQIGLSWTINPSGASSVTDWLVQYSTNNTTWTTFNDGVSTTTSATVTGLTNGTLYYFRVAPINPATTGAFGTSASATPRTTPGAPIITTLTPGNTQVVVSWSAPANGGSAITDYDLEYSSNSGSTWTAWASGTTSTATSATVTGLTNGTAYIFRVLAKNAAGSSANSSTSSSSTPRTVPNRPGTTVLTAGDRQILVTWDAPSSNGGSAITDYTVERVIDGNTTWVQIADGVSVSTSFIDTGLTNGTGYYYRLYAVNAAGISVVSQQVGPVKPVGPTVAPTSVVGTASDAQVALTWTAPATNGGAISDYTIQYSSDSGATWTTFSDTVSATASVTVTGLTNGTAYVFRVAATNPAGLGAYSTSSAARTPVGAPGVPTNVAGVAASAQVSLTWTAPVSNGGSAITDYIIQYSSNSGSTWTTFADTVSTTTSVTVTGLTNGTSYVFHVAAKNAAGTGSYSTNSSSLIPFTLPNAPTSVSAATGARQSNVTWTAPASNGGSAITGYAIRYSTNNGSTWSSPVLTGSSATSFLVTGLSVTTSAHYFQVATINVAGQSGWSANSPYVYIEDYPAAPTGVTGVVGNTQVALSWTAPTSNGGSAISNYDVQYSSDNGVMWTSFSHTASTATSLTVTGLTNGVDYLFKVAAINRWGSANFATTAVTYNPFTLPGAPSNVAGAAGSSQVVVTWTASASNGRAITDYVIQFSSNSGSTWATFNDGTSTATSATVTGLTNSIPYIFKVAGVSAAGTSSYSSNTSAVTPQAVPSTPLSVVGVGGNTQVSLAWSAPSSNGGQAITDYVIQYSSNSGSAWTTFTDLVSSATSAVVTGLTNGTSYIFQVAAKNSVGTGGYSVASAAVIPFTVPGQPASVLVTAGINQVAVSWTAPTSDGGSALTDYVVEYSTNSGTTWITFADSISTTTSVTVTGLTNGIGYVFRVSAKNVAGTGLPSISSSSVVPRTAPSAAQSVVGVSGNAQVALSWSAPSSNGGDTVTDYVVQYSSDGTTWTTFTDSVSSTASCTVTGLTNGTAYTFRVAAVNAGGTGMYSVVSAAVTPFTTPDAPSCGCWRSGECAGRRQLDRACKQWWKRDYSVSSFVCASGNRQLWNVVNCHCNSVFERDVYGHGPNKRNFVQIQSCRN
jgi:hypothetical protein